MIPKRIAITSGDTDGIGPEVTAKALSQIRPRKGVQLCLWRSSFFPNKYLRMIDRRFVRHTVTNWDQARHLATSAPNLLIDVESPLPPPRWVETMGRAGARGEIAGLVTAPLSKEGIFASGIRDKGHTEILKRTTKTPHVFMTFLGKKFNVVLLTGHVSLKKAYAQIEQPLLETCITKTVEATSFLPPARARRPIALVGCNPHAGENGVIDNKENLVYKSAMAKFKRKKVEISGPLVPDVCFRQKFWSQYSFYIASTHDQGLIPFKMIHHDFGGVQLSLGLPFVRTSVDHGTAKDIFNKNRARETSMVNALNVAIKLIESKPIKW